MTEQRAAALKNRIQKNLRRLAPWATREGVSCYRVYDRDIPELPLALDRYEGELVAHVYEPRHGVSERELAAWLDAGAVGCGVPRDRIHVKRRTRAVGGTAYESEADGQFSRVREGGLTFLVQLEAHIDVGLFLDHRPARLALQRDAAGKRVLNLFAYTGAFSVHAAKGGAALTVTVDLAPNTVRWAEQNLRENGFAGAQHVTHCADARSFLASDHGSYDIAVVDPPTVSKSRRSDQSFEVQRDHPELLDRVLARLAPGGHALFSTNFTGFTLTLPSGARAVETTDDTVPPDFTHRPPPHRSWRITRA